MDFLKSVFEAYSDLGKRIIRWLLAWAEDSELMVWEEEMLDERLFCVEHDVEVLKSSVEYQRVNIEETVVIVNLINDYLTSLNIWLQRKYGGFN